MPYFKRKLKPKSKPKPRRRTQAVPLAMALGAKAVKTVIGKYRKSTELYNKRARYNRIKRIEQSDNIVSVPPIIIGKQREPSFQEKVANTIRPPLTFKRNYQFSAECGSGRKGFFAMNINTMDSNDLLNDITAYKSALTTDTATGDATLSASGFNDNAQFYIDYHKEYIQMVNSSSNSLTGKIHLYVHKRDTDSAYDSAGINPINLMMYYCANSTSSNVTPAGGVTGFGFTNASGSSTGYATVFNMPGSSLNVSQTLCASTDLTLSPTSSFIKERMDFWFKKINTHEFSLKPGQQFNSSYVLHLDNNKICRELQKFVHIQNVSYSLVVEFQGGIVGNSIVNNEISTGTAQLSIVRSNTRILGLENKLRKKIMLQTAQLVDIPNSNQIIINNDSGVQDTGVELDA